MDKYDFACALSVMLAAHAMLPAENWTYPLFLFPFPFLVFFEAPSFTKCVARYLTDEQLGELQAVLASTPEAGEVMPGSGGFRKLRWPDTRRSKGARGGLRIVSFHFAQDAPIWLMTIFGKDEMVDLTPAQRRMLKQAIEAETKARRHLLARGKGKR